MFLLELAWPTVFSAAGKKTASIGNHVNTIHHDEAYRSIIRYGVGVFGEIAPARMQGVPVQLPLNCFRLRDQCFPDQAVPGRLPQVEQLRLLWHPTCYQ